MARHGKRKSGRHSGLGGVGYKSNAGFHGSVGSGMGHRGKRGKRH